MTLASPLSSWSHAEGTWLYATEGCLVAERQRALAIGRRTSGRSSCTGAGCAESVVLMDGWWAGNRHADWSQPEDDLEAVCFARAPPRYALRPPQLVAPRTWSASLLSDVLHVVYPFLSRAACRAKPLRESRCPNPVRACVRCSMSASCPDTDGMAAGAHARSAGCISHG